MLTLKQEGTTRGILLVNIQVQLPTTKCELTTNVIFHPGLLCNSNITYTKVDVDSDFYLPNLSAINGGSKGGSSNTDLADPLFLLISIN